MALKTKLQQKGNGAQTQTQSPSWENLLGTFMDNLFGHTQQEQAYVSPLARSSPTPTPVDITNWTKQQVSEYLKTNKLPSNTPTPTSSPSVMGTSESLDQITNNIKNGFIKYGRPEAAQYAPYFAQVGQDLPDPYLPATQALKESSGGKTNTGKNNWFNIMNPDHTPVDYPDMQTALLGGNGHQGFKGMMHNGLYDKYLKSGNLADFFTTYSPPADSNGDIPTQISKYNDLRSNFTDH